MSILKKLQGMENTKFGENLKASCQAKLPWQKMYVII